jgi:hypothetical protein
MRRGLFERSSNSPPPSAEEISKLDERTGGKNKSSISKNKQKNRSGRRVISKSVTDDDDRVHIAHTLLNVHNKNPLEAFKLALPKGGSRRLLKQAGKSARKKIERLRRATKTESPAMKKILMMEAESNNQAKEEEIGGF